MAEGGKTTKGVLCSSCLTEDPMLIPACQSRDQQHKFCVDCMLNCIRSRVDEKQHLGLSCPWNNDCHSNMDKKMLKDIVQQLSTVKKAERGHLSTHLDKLAEISAKQECPNEYCPNKECSQSHYMNDQETWTELFPACPHCGKVICETCKHALGRNGYRDHICASESPKTTLQVIKTQIEEILTQCVLLNCPNKKCEMYIRRLPLVKEDGDCNTMQCRRCRNYYCYICSEELGEDKLRAHKHFPHKNAAYPEGPDCWLFNDALEKTEWRAQHLRKLRGVTNFLKRLRHTNEEKTIFLEECRDILGIELYQELQKNKAKWASDAQKITWCQILSQIFATPHNSKNTGPLRALLKQRNSFKF